MLTLKKVKELVEAPSHAKRTPSPKMLFEEGIVLLRREFDQGSHLMVYNSGYVLFSAGKRNTVFHIHDCCGDYAYDAAEGKGDVIKEEYFENCEWHIRALFEGERKMEDNQAKCEGAGRSNVCVSYHALSEDWSEIADRTINIKEHGIMTPATVRPEKDGNGYEIIAGHRRCHGGERAGLDEIPCIVREMTDLEAVREMKNSNKQRGDPLPSELAKLLDLELEAIKRQGARPKNDKEAEALGKLSVEIVGKEHDMNYKKVLRYVRLNHLVPELLEKVDAKNMGFMPAVELSYIKPENQRLIAVSIDGEQSSPSVKQAKRLRELDQEGLLNGDVIDGILSEEKREVDNVIISTDELNKYFGKEVTPAKMKEQIIALLDEWKEKQPPELAKPEKKHELDK